MAAEGNVKPPQYVHALSWDTFFKIPRNLFDLRSIEGSVRSSENCEVLYQHWRLTVENYTARNLTKAEDKLPALAGLASVFRAQLNNTYCAGLFAGDFHRGLV